MPIGRWFRGELRDFLRDHLRSRDFAQSGLFDRAVVWRRELHAQSAPAVPAETAAGLELR